MVKEGFPFVIAPAIIALVLGYFQLWPLVVLFVILAAFMAYFFRDPHRTIPEGDDIVVSAADGKVTRIDENPDGKLVSVFLSPLDVHINRAPIAGEITSVEYIAGKKGPATTNDASFVNERNSLTIVGERMTVVCTQIAGIVARRIVCWNKQGDNLKLGQRFGLIKFSSRTDLLMPPNVDLLVKIGDRVVGGETIIARLQPPVPDSILSQPNQKLYAEG
ncbi:MAG TPA: phosphatidylserine decarboxylase [Pyrinomonadaceae bacterium]|nr:phosphatidylserine decarboxylase [Pyrinomonadaceae bacterium]